MTRRFFPNHLLLTLPSYWPGIDSKTRRFQHWHNNFGWATRSITGRVILWDFRPLVCLFNGGKKIHTQTLHLNLACWISYITFAAVSTNPLKRALRLRGDNIKYCQPNHAPDLGAPTINTDSVVDIKSSLHNELGRIRNARLTGRVRTNLPVPLRTCPPPSIILPQKWPETCPPSRPQPAALFSTKAAHFDHHSSHCIQPCQVLPWQPSTFRLADCWAEPWRGWPLREWTESDCEITRNWNVKCLGSYVYFRNIIIQTTHSLLNPSHFYLSLGAQKDASY